MVRAVHQSFAAGIVMQIVQLLLPKALTLNRFRMAARLPEAALPVGERLGPQRFQKALRPVVSAIVAQLSARVLAKIGECTDQALRIPVGVERDEVNVRRHDDLRVDAEEFLAIAEGQTVGDDSATCLRNEHRQPFYDRVREIINRGFGVYTVTFHAPDCIGWVRLGGGGGDLRLGRVIGSPPR